MQSPHFTVAGMSSSTTTHHSPNLNTWGGSSTGGTLSSSFSDSLSQSRSHYQSGYLMTVPQGSQRVDEVPVVKTKAKMNQILSRSTTEFGMDSMFQSSRQRQTLADEDAPPTSSVFDLPDEISMEPSPARFQPRRTLSERAPFTPRHSTTAPPVAQQPNQPLYIVVFGYPVDKFSLTVEYFKAIGDATDPEESTELVNCFRIGYRDPGDALRAVRKNGEVISGTFMIGAKWADTAQAEAILGLQPVIRSQFAASAAMPQNMATSPDTQNAMAVDQPDPFSPSYSTSRPGPTPHHAHHHSTPTPVGTPIKLAPSGAAFRKVPAVSSSSKPATPQHGPVWGSGLISTPVGGSGGGTGASTAQPNAMQTSPSKGLIGQMSDLIFGW
ncbi:hypothetical protein CVT26_003056 [Gymnopilus dilepis]|uniref:RRM Nup35-type domain-containing protein n=1 Tax=Gymnopilus dilepis TaxID=231916 RepID=A0A409Y4M7_9AGAR|nr:hypothetical protein CVT26_003056 [Gymnopilus dilepis]